MFIFLLLIAQQTMEAFNFQILNGCGDIIDLKHALMPETFPKWWAMTKAELTSYVANSGHCSALIKVRNICGWFHK